MTDPFHAKSSIRSLKGPDGLPLFVEELLQTVLDSGSVRTEGDHFVIARPSSPITIPERLEDLLMSRLDRLGAAKIIAQRGAILGRAFSQDLMRAVLATDAQDQHRSDEQTAEGWRHAERCLTRLVEAGVLRQSGTAQTTYEFKHALIQKAADQSLLKRTRQAYHLQTARVLETQFPHVAETQPELVARHFSEALQHTRALDYWQKAGELARDRSANKEAIHHFAEGLKSLEALPESEERDRRELALRIASITPVIAVEGYVAEATARTAERALVLCSTTWRCRQAVPRAVRALGQSAGGREIRRRTPPQRGVLRGGQPSAGPRSPLDEPSAAGFFVVCAW